MKKKALSLLLASALTLGVFAGCSSSSSSSEDETATATTETETDDSEISGDITFVMANDTTGASEKMLEAFNEKYPNIHVDVQMSSGASDDVKKGLMTSLAAGDTDPDVFACDIIWISQFAAAGWLLDVTEDLEARADDYLAGPLSTCYYDGKAYAYPDYTDVGLLYYRTDLIDEAPTTWDELVELSKQYQASGDVEYGFLFQEFQGEPTSCNTLEFIKQNGGSDLTDGVFDFENENTYEALTFIKSLIEDGISPESVLNSKPDDSNAIFQEGNALFMRNWTYSYGVLQSETSKVAGNVGVAALPVGPSGSESSGTLGGWNYAINSQTDSPEAAKVFVEFMSSYEAQKIEASIRGTLPTVAAVYDDAEVQEALPFLADAKEAADNAKPRPQVRDYPTISTIFQEYFHKILAGDADIESTIKEMDEKLNEALEEME